MALSRPPIKLAKPASAVISLRNAMSILFLGRRLQIIKVRFLTKFWKDHWKPYTCLHRKNIFCSQLVSITLSEKLMLNDRGGNYA
jgi:hypothetical protein